ncbi:MAG TPA: hypothetical protein VNE82_15430 [Candidatus Binataceae bacterium]|nr:hypothetical protein [Candidatus Binataceae bacterium]
MAHEVSNAIVVTAYTMQRALGALSSAERAKLLPRRAGEHVEQEKLIVLKLGALPDLEQMRGDGKIALMRRLPQLQDYYNRAGDECDGRDDRRDRGRGYPVDRRHSVATLFAGKS